MVELRSIRDSAQQGKPFARDRTKLYQTLLGIFLILLSGCTDSEYRFTSQPYNDLKEDLQHAKPLVVYIAEPALHSSLEPRAEPVIIQELVISEEDPPIFLEMCHRVFISGFLFIVANATAGAILCGV